VRPSLVAATFTSEAASAATAAKILLKCVFVAVCHKLRCLETLCCGNTAQTRVQSNTGDKVQLVDSYYAPCFQS
jgi:glutamate synthase domain-containing protein 2